MKLVILGATGNIGTEVTRQALEAGHDVTAYVRRPEALPTQKGLSVVGGSIDDLDGMAAAFRGADAVLCTIGGKPGANLMQRVLSSITQAVHQAGVARFVLVSGFGVGDTKEKASLPARLIYKTLVNKLFTDKALAEAAVLPGLELNWTVAYPVNLKKAPRLESATIKDLNDLFTVPGLPTLPFENVAEALLQIVSNNNMAGQRVLITTPGGWKSAH